MLPYALTCSQVLTLYSNYRIYETDAVPDDNNAVAVGVSVTLILLILIVAVTIGLILLYLWWRCVN